MAEPAADIFTRKIVHIDMDAFYASVEQRDNPELRGKPVAVGGSSKRGVVAAASYEARRFGIHSAMPSITAKRRCPELVFVRARFAVYKEVSRQIRSIFSRYTDLIEPLSMDEAFLDLTEPKVGPPSATLLANRIREEIATDTGCTASAGVSYCKFLAKVASGINKPNGITVVKPEDAAAFIGSLPIEKFFGVGKVTAKKFKKYGINNGYDLRQCSELMLTQKFGKAGRFYYRIAQGLDARPVRTHRVRKSVSAERTFFDDIDSGDEMSEKIATIAAEVAARLERAGASGKTVTLKIKYHDFVIRTRSRTLPRPLGTEAELKDIANHLLRSPALPDRPVRLLGIGVSNLKFANSNQEGQLDIWSL